MKSIMIAVALLAVLCTAALAQNAQLILPGDKFQDGCFSHNQLDQAACAGFIGGTVDAYLATGDFCLSADVTPQNIVPRVVGFIHQHSAEYRRMTGTWQIVMALRRMYPCVVNRLPPGYVPLPFWNH